MLCPGCSCDCSDEAELVLQARVHDDLGRLVGTPAGPVCGGEEHAAAFGKIGQIIKGLFCVSGSRTCQIPRPKPEVPPLVDGVVAMGHDGEFKLLLRQGHAVRVVVLCRESDVNGFARRPGQVLKRGTL